MGGRPLYECGGGVAAFLCLLLTDYQNIALSERSVRQTFLSKRQRSASVLRLRRRVSRGEKKKRSINPPRVRPEREIQDHGGVITSRTAPVTVYPGSGPVDSASAESVSPK